MTEQLLNIKFVAEVKKHPCLYNYNLKEYSKREETDKAWAAVGAAVHLTRSECKERWKNLRSVFVRHLKPRNGTNVSKKPYYLAQFMQFALPYIKFSKYKPDTQESLTNEHSSSQSILPDEETTQPMDEIPSTSPPYSPFESIPVEYMPASKQQTSRNTKHRDITELLKTEQVIAAYFKTKHSKLLEDSNNEQTSNKMFLLSVLPDMNKMSEKRKRMFKQRMLRLVDEFLDEDSD